MDTDTGSTSSPRRITVSEGVRRFIRAKKCNFRVCTSCGGPILLSTMIKPPKATDLEIYVEGQIIYVSMYQYRYLDRIDEEMIPRFLCDY